MGTGTLPSTPFRRTDLPRLGLSPHRLRRLVADGEIRPLLRGVYLRADVERTLLTRARAVALVVDGRHVVCDRTAAWVHGVDALTAAEVEVPPPIEVCTASGRHPTERTAAQGHERDLRPGEIMQVEGLRVTTPARTALDLGCVLRRREAFAALNELARVHGLTSEHLAAEARRRYGGRRGVVQLRSFLPLIEARVESPRESWTLLAIHDAGLPLPEPQVWVEIDGAPTYRLDFAYRFSRVAIEYDGHDAHDVTDEQRRYDAGRRAWLREHGWTVIVVKLGDFGGSGQDRWTDRLGEALQPTYSNRRW